MNEVSITDGRAKPMNQRVRDAQQHLRMQQALLVSHKETARHQLRARLSSPWMLLLATGVGVAVGHFSARRRAAPPQAYPPTQESTMNKIISSPVVTKLIAVALTTALMSVLSGCASTPVPNAQMAVADAAVQHATTAATSEDASAELQIATAKLASARLALAEQHNERAAQLAEQAQVDAQVAEMRAQSERSRRAAQESIEAARVLREEIERQTVR